MFVVLALHAVANAFFQLSRPAPEKRDFLNFVFLLEE